MNTPKLQRLLLARILVIGVLAGCAAPTATSAPATPTSTRMPIPTSTPTLFPTATIDLVQAQKSATLYEQDFELNTTDGLVEKGGKWSKVG